MYFLIVDLPYVSSEFREVQEPSPALVAMKIKIFKVYSFLVVLSAIFRRKTFPTNVARVLNALVFVYLFNVNLQVLLASERLVAHVARMRLLFPLNLVPHHVPIVFLLLNKLLAYGAFAVQPLGIASYFVLQESETGCKRFVAQWTFSAFAPGIFKVKAKKFER